MNMLDGRIEEKVLVVAEDASVAAIPTNSDRYSNLVLVAQQGERSESFAQRAMQRIERLARMSWRPRVGVLAVSAAIGAAALEARALVAQALIARLAEAEPQFVLVGHSGFPDSARHELFALVQTLSEAAPSVAFRVDLSNPAPAASRQATLLTP